MQILINIPDNEIPTKQDLLSIDLCFFNGKVSQCDYPFMELPKGHGRLIDADALDINIQQYYESQLNNSYAKAFVEFMAFVDTVPTIIEADKENE